LETQFALLNPLPDLPGVFSTLLPRQSAVAVCISSISKGLSPHNPPAMIVIDAREDAPGAIEACKELQTLQEFSTVPRLMIVKDLAESEPYLQFANTEALPLIPKLLERRLLSTLKTWRAERERDRLTQEIRDIQDRLQQEIKLHKETEKILSENERTLRSIFRSIESTAEAIMITDRSETIYYANPAFSALTGWEPEEIFGNTPTQVCLIESSPVTVDEMKAIARDSGCWQGEVTMQRRGGHTYEAHLDINAVKEGIEGDFEGFIFIQRDITAMKRIMDELERLARLDGLTGLYNRRYFMERLAHERERSQRYKNKIALLMVDLDHFKYVNDTYGHLFGDRVLEFVGAQISQMARGSDFAGRYGGEELCIALPQTPLDGARVFAERLRNSIAQEVFTTNDGRSFRVTCSIGIAELDVGEPNLDKVFDQADNALYHAKRDGRNRVICHAS
jgi:diguanylate cyclase (GGDEF)-like protein/PAS domain S-box-containing protein